VRRKYEEEDISSYWMASKKKREYCKLKREAPNHTLRRPLFGRSYGPVVRQGKIWMMNANLSFSPWNQVDVYKIFVSFKITSLNWEQWDNFWRVLINMPRLEQRIG
jgi:hypothetical protein